MVIFIAEMNNYQFKLVKIKDDFIWHKHDDTDEVFIVLDGTILLSLKMRQFKLMKEK